MRRGARSALAAPAALLLPVVADAYLDGPPPGRTGGFGEPTCRECHFDGPVEDPSLGLEVRGAPARWEPGAEYRLEVVLARPGLAAAGFQLAARFAAGDRAGRQAGTLAALDDRVAVIDSGGIRYAQHTAAGTRPTEPDTARWPFVWTAPPSSGAAVAFHAAANAADGDASELGDVIGTIERVSARPCPGEAD
ncbi:MAG: hypothetical protein KY397_01310 [Gemmatimonadetes bacterium]|nr:hypothetical protein [Gemmatimonadota bacterium]